MAPVTVNLGLTKAIFIRLDKLYNMWTFFFPGVFSANLGEVLYPVARDMSAPWHSTWG